MVGDSIYDIGATKAGCEVVIIPSVFTKYCTFDNSCKILNRIEELPLFLENSKSTALF